VGKVRLNATMTQNVVMYTVEINTENPQNILLPYLTANVRFVVQRNPMRFWFERGAALSPSSLAEVAPIPLFEPDRREPGGSPGGDAKSSMPKGLEGAPRIIWLKEGEFVRPRV